MGSAVSGMHYTAMGAAKFFPAPEMNVFAMTIQPAYLAGAIGATTLLITAFGLIGALIDKRLANIAELLKASQELARVLIKTAAEGITTIDEYG